MLFKSVVNLSHPVQGFRPLPWKPNLPTYRGKGIVYSTSNVLYALDETFGAILWSSAAWVGSPCALSATLGILYTYAGNILYAFGAKLGTLKWKYSVNEALLIRP